jgi:outer membrane receptor for ferrienterochelin and colicins
VDHDFITNRFNHQLQSDWTINDRWSFNGSASYQDLNRRTLTKLFNSTTGEETLDPNGAQDKATIDMAMVRGFFLYKLSSTISLQPGFEVNLSNASGDRIDRHRSINDYAAFISVEYKPTSNINIRPGVRFIYNSAYDAPPVIPSINTKFSLGKNLDLRLAYAYGFRAPALRELYFYFYDASHNLEGNPDLKAEYSNSFTGSLTWNAPQQKSVVLKSTLSSFYNSVKNLIDLVQYENTQVYKYANIARNKTTGVSLENNLYWKNVSLTLGGSYIGRYNVYSEEDSSLPDFTWSPEVNAVASYAFKEIGNTVSVYYKYNGERQSYSVVDDGIVFGELEDFHTLDASVSQNFLTYLNLTVGAKNLLNVTQLQNSMQDGAGHSAGGSSVPMSYGRSYFATLTVRWSK